MARCYFTDGVFVTGQNNKSALDTIKELLENDSITLFEAEIQYQDYLVRTDILIKHKNHLKLIEIKAKSIIAENLGRSILIW